MGGHVGGEVNVVGDLMYENFLQHNIEEIDQSDYIFVTIHMKNVKICIQKIDFIRWAL